MSFWKSSHDLKVAATKAILATFLILGISGMALPALGQGLCQEALGAKSALATTTNAPTEISMKAMKVLGQKSISLARFLERKSQFIEYFKQVNGPKTEEQVADSAFQLESDTDKLAFFEAYAEYSGRDFLSWMKLANDNTKKSARYLNMISSLKMDGGMSGYSLLKFIEDAYLVANQPPFGWQKFFGQNYQQIIEQRIDLEAAQSDIASALKSLGLIRNNSWLDQARLWQRKFSNAERLTGWAGSNWFLGKIFGMDWWYPLYSLPNTSLARAGNAVGMTPSEIEARARSGLGQVGAAVDFATDKIRRAFIAFLLGSATLHVVAHVHDLHTLLDEAIATEHVVVGATKLILHGNASLDYTPSPELLETMQTKVYQVWATNFQTLHGRTPDPLHNLVDRDLWLTKVTELVGS